MREIGLLKRYWHRTTLLVLLLGLAGCGAKQMPLGKVSGVVTHDGQPVSSGVVHFLPEAGPAATGKLDEQGRYRLTTYQANDGAVTGHHQVFFTPIVPEAEFTDAEYVANTAKPAEIPRDFLPDDYLAPATSGLTAEVKSGSNQVDFALPSH